MIPGLARRAQAGHGAAVKAGPGRDDLCLFNASFAAPVLAGQLDGGFVGLSPGVAEEHRIHRAVGGDPGGQFPLLQGEIKVGHMLQSTQLFTEGLLQCRVAMAQAADRNARNTVQVTVAVVIPKPTAPAMGEGHRKTPVGVHHRSPMGRAWGG